MIVLLTSRYVSGKKKDVEVLQHILAALGVERGESPKDPGRRASSISADFWPSLCRLQVIADSGDHARTEMFFHVSDPLHALRIVKQEGGEVVEGLPDEAIAQVGFRVKLPSGARVHFGALPADPDFDLLPSMSGGLDAGGKKFGIVVSRFNAFITERLLQGAFDGLVRSGARRSDITIVRVPGAFEIPLASRKLAETKEYDAILCIGCLLRGDTAHYDVIVNEVTRGIGQSAQETGVPHAFGVLTCDTLEQAIDRAGLKMGNKGLEAATAAIEMVNLAESLGNPARKASTKVSGKKKLAVKGTSKPKTTSKPISRRKKK